MKWLIHQNIASETEASAYVNSVKIAYLLNLKLVSIGIDESTYFLREGVEKLPLENKIDYLLASNASNRKEYEIIAESKQNLKDFAKSKNKSSKQIVAINLIKKTLNRTFNEAIKANFQIAADVFHLDVFKPLIDDELFYFYRNKDSSLVDANNNFDFLNDILQLDLPDPENGNPMFFLSNLNSNGVLMDIDFLNSTDKNAEDKNNFYGESSYVFPLMSSLTSNQLISTRKELEKTTIEFRQKMEEWATICYANPNTNLGLEYFRNNLQPYLKSSKNDVLENTLMQNLSSLTQKKLETQIIIGEAPIEKIWELYLISKTIKQEVYDNLIKIKTEQFPRFEGRWPIAFLKPTAEAQNYLNDEAQNDGVKSVRKSISLD
jgi:hypothetical protein